MDERDAFLRRLLANEPDLRAFIGSLVREAHAREDVFQDVAVTLWQRAGKYDPERSFGAWARGVAANKILQRRDQDRRFPVVFSSETIRAIVDAFDRTEETASHRRDALAHCLERLPAEPRRLLGLRYEEGLGVDEIASRVNRTVDAVYRGLSRVRAALEACIRRRLAAEAGDH